MKNRAMLDVADGCKETSHFVGAEDDRKIARLPDRRDGVGAVVAAHGDPVHESQGGTGLLIVAE